MSFQHNTLLFLHQFQMSLLIYLLSSIELATSSIAIDKEALISFKTSLILDPTNNKNPLSTWAQESPLSPCNWTGVQCDTRAQRVVGLDLSGLGLSGPISPKIGNLTSLQSLNLHNNRLVGPIPPEITRLSKLRTLNASLNIIDGSLPSNMGRFRELEVLDLTGNMMTGKIPQELSQLRKIEVLKLGRNRFYGEIPRSLGNVSSLVTLDLGTNNLGGALPDELGQLRNLKELDLTINNLTGRFPDSIYNLTSLLNLAVASNNLWGEIPYNVADTLPNLSIFNFCFNKFTGKIPGSLHNLTGITHIRMAHNFLHGPVPPGLQNLASLEMYNIGFNHIVSSGDDGLSFITDLTNSSKLTFLAIDGNRLEGLIPDSIGDLSGALSKLYMGGNRISGEIPSSIGRLKGLTLLNLSSNSLSGPIPAEIGDLTELQELGLAGNGFSGSIPSSLAGLKKLNIIDLSGNSLLGSVPGSFGSFRSLLSMDLSSNKLNGTIPKECLNLPSLSTVLNLSNNMLTGPLPGEIRQLKNVVTIDLSGNLLSGPIPSSIGECQSLQNLFMRNNSFSGPIPEALADVKGLEVLDLSSNQLSGFIDDLHKLQALKYLNLSFNNLEGLVPKFENTSTVDLSGNENLCSDHFACVNSRAHNTKRVAIVIAVSSVAAVSALFFVLGSILYLRSNRAKIKSTGEEDSGLRRIRTISYEELRRATGGFGNENLVGRGGSGAVYRGRLSDGLAVAVKVLDARVTGSWKSFTAECAALRNARHRNVAGLVTVCSSMDFKGTEFLALVYEYLGNGSLEDWLRGRKRKANGDPLSVLERVSVAIDVACALEYLHCDCEVPVVHCDIKPSNVLLDDDLVAKVGDFGIARMLMEKKRREDNEAASISSTHALKGSIGYIPPEYGRGERASTAGDSYSFGVTILELFTGMSPTHESFSADLNLPKWVQFSFPENLGRVIEPKLLELSGKISQSASNVVSPDAEYECVMKVIEVALCCTRDSPYERMTMKTALQSLRSAKHDLLKQAVSEPNANQQHD